MLDYAARYTVCMYVKQCWTMNITTSLPASDTDNYHTRQLHIISQPRVYTHWRPSLFYWQLWAGR